jgi:polysaccharide biosynthesis protein PslJ
VSAAVYRAEAEAPLPHWPFTLMVAAYPVWFVLGLSGFMWVALALPMAAVLIRRRNLVVPKGLGWWLIFLIAMATSVVSIDSGPRLAGYVLRAGYYLAATVFLIYLLNGGSGLTIGHIVRAFNMLWIFAVVGGYLALVLGGISFHAPLWYLLPKPLLDNELINTLVTPGFADVQDIIGFPIPRPKAPFAYTNSWGSMMALSTPFALMALSDRRIGLSSRLVRWVMVAAVVPMVISLNRGLWLSLGLGLVYGALRLGLGGHTGVFVRLLVVGVVLAAVLALSPLGGLVTSRVETGHSDNDRKGLAVAALEGAAERPLFGWGAPRPNVRNLPSIGTHGQIWLVTFSHGFVGGAGFLGALLSFFYWTRRQATTTGLWAHVVILVGLVQLPVYLMIPNSLFAVMAAVAIALRCQTQPAAHRQAELVLTRDLTRHLIREPVRVS